ncbi:MAG: ATP-binding protein [Candidatus Bathyarchaeota archaeon]|nr:ATP-binding protein [Candidatus Bathyarchaeota archaeon]
MNIKRKLIAGLAIAYLLVFSGFLFYTNNLILKGYLEFEQEDVTKQTEIGLNTLELRISEVNQITLDYASRDDTYYFIQNNMRHFINDLISTSSFIENELNFMIFIDNEENVLYSKAFDLSTLRSLEIDESTIDLILDYDYIASEHQTSGIIEINNIPTMIAAHKITYSDDDLPPVGTLICGRYIDAIEVAKLCDYSYQDLSFVKYTDSPVEPGDNIRIFRQDDENIIGIASIPDINGEPYLVMLAESPRDLYHQGERTILYFYSAMLIVGVVGGLLSIYLLNKTVLERILGLSEEVSNIDPRSLESKTLCVSGDDEISRLSQDIDGMLQTITEYQDRLTSRERMATIGETAAMVGHDLRNPLQVIYMLSSRMKRVARKLSEIEETEPYVREIEYIDENLNEQTSYMNKIVSDLQDFSKSIALQVEEVNLEDMVKDVIGTLSLDENISVSVGFRDQSEIQEIDGNYFRRVIVNLLTNAVQAMPEGGKLTVEGRKSENKSTISVSDTGVGVSEENIRKLFTPLFTTKAKGTGLGLAVCKRIVDAHKGEISVESKEGVGTTFTVTLPNVQENEAEAEPILGVASEVDVSAENV